MGGEKRDYQTEVASRIEGLDDRLDVELLGETGYGSDKYPAYRVIAEGGDKDILISGGVHGTEPAGVHAVLEFLENRVDRYLDTFTFYAYPCINPHGYATDSWLTPPRTNLNRCFKEGATEKEVVLVMDSLKIGPEEYLFTMDMHECSLDEASDPDPDKRAPTEFYMWEVCKDKSRRVGEKIIEALEQANIPVCKWDTIFTDINSGGVIYYPEGCNCPQYVDYTTFEGYLYNNYTPQSITTETYTAWDMDYRVNAHLIALETALREHKKRSQRKGE